MAQTGLEALLRLKTDDAQTRQVVEKINKMVNDHLKSVDLDIDVEQALKQMNVVNTQFDKAKGHVKSFEMQVQSATGELQKMKLALKYDGKGNLTGAKIVDTSNIANATKQANEFLKLTRRIVQETNRANKLTILGSGTQSEIAEIERLERSIDSAKKAKTELDTQMKKSSYDFSKTYQEASNIESKALVATSGYQEKKESQQFSQAKKDADDYLKKVNQIAQATNKLNKIEILGSGTQSEIQEMERLRSTIASTTLEKDKLESKLSQSQYGFFETIRKSEDIMAKTDNQKTLYQEQASLNQANAQSKEYLSLTRQIVDSKKKLNTIEISGKNDQESIKNMEQLKREIDQATQSREKLNKEMDASATDFTNTIDQGKAMEAEITYDANTKQSNQNDKVKADALRQYNVLQQKTLSLQKMLVAEEAKASAFGGNTKERQTLIAQLHNSTNAYVKELRNMEALHKSDATTYNKMTTSAKEYKNQISLIRQQSLAARSVNEGFFRDMISGWKDASARIVTYTIIYRSLWEVIQGFRNGIETIAELNKSFVDIQMVTGYTNNEIRQLSENYADLAKNMGSTIDQVALGATEWLRQGKSVEETNELLEQSLIFSKVGGMESAEATEYLTSTLNGYKMAVEDASKVVDVFSKLD